MSNRILVLGAGFTKAFFPNAPLLEDTYDIDTIKKGIAGYDHAKRVLELELRRCGHDGRLNVERLLSRLESGMPYDRSRRADNQLARLRELVQEVFIARIKRARDNNQHDRELFSLARYCIQKKIHCLTYNYDDLFDEALWSAAGQNSIWVEDETDGGGFRAWNPSTGYGFPCESYHKRAVGVLFPGQNSPPTPSSMWLLKLHGSMSWRIRLGVEAPYEMRSIVHFADWKDEFGIIPQDVDQYLEPQPFIVPPVLVKSELVKQPILRFLWGKAYKILSEAEEVIFVGYSFPQTDIASLHLFSEAVNYPKTKVRIVNFAKTQEDQEHIGIAYAKVFPAIGMSDFRFDGALAWADEFIEKT